MDYSQFLNMSDELSLLAVVVILFMADLFCCGSENSTKPSKTLSLIAVPLLLVQTVYMLPTALRLLVICIFRLR